MAILPAVSKGLGFRYRSSARTTRAALDALGDLRWLFANLALDARYRDWFRRRAWIRTIHGTTRIEGNSLSDLEVEEVLERLPIARQKDALEVVATRTALAFVDEIAVRRTVRIDEGLVREIHRRVLDDIDPLLRPGEYRSGENRVADAEGNIVYRTPSGGDVPSLMRAFASWLRSKGRTEHPAVLSALAHLQLVAIHPFYDGNGRTARALSRLLLVRNGWALDGLVSLDAYLDLQRRDYFAAIRASLGPAYAPGYDATPFVTYYLGAIVAAAEHVLARVKGVAELLAQLRSAVSAGEIGPQLTDPLVYAWINGSLRASDYREITGRTGPSASRDLAQAVASGHLVPTGQTRARRYLPGPRLRQVEPVPVERRPTPRRRGARRI